MPNVDWLSIDASRSKLHSADGKRAIPTDETSQKPVVLTHFCTVQYCSTFAQSMSAWCVPVPICANLARLD